MEKGQVEGEDLSFGFESCGTSQRSQVEILVKPLLSNIGISAFQNFDLLYTASLLQNSYISICFS